MAPLGIYAGDNRIMTQSVATQDEDLETFEAENTEELVALMGLDEESIDMDHAEEKFQRLQEQEEQIIVLTSSWAGNEFWGEWVEQLEGLVTATSDDGIQIQSDTLKDSRHATGKEWGPKGQVEKVITVPPSEDKLVFEKGAQGEVRMRDGTLSEADIVVRDDQYDGYGFKWVLEGDTYDAKEDIKELEWEETHRTYEDGIGWVVDKGTLRMVAEHLAENGWMVAIDFRKLKGEGKFDEEDFEE
jgi:hypothetical protein